MGLAERKLGLVVFGARSSRTSGAGHGRMRVDRERCGPEEGTCASHYELMVWGATRLPPGV